MWKRSLSVGGVRRGSVTVPTVRLQLWASSTAMIGYESGWTKKSKETFQAGLAGMHAWERGSNENLNGLIRQYLPRKMCMRELTQAHCDHIACKLNSRPRKLHGFKAPRRVYIENSRSLHFKVEPKSGLFALYSSNQYSFIDYAIHAESLSIHPL